MPRDQPNGAKLREPPASKRLHEPTRTWRPTSPAVMPQTGLHNTPLSAKRASQRARPATDGSRQASRASELLLLLLLTNLAHVLFLRDQSSQSVCQRGMHVRHKWHSISTHLCLCITHTHTYIYIYIYHTYTHISYIHIYHLGGRGGVLCRRSRCHVL